MTRDRASACLASRSACFLTLALVLAVGGCAPRTATAPTPELPRITGMEVIEQPDRTRLSITVEHPITYTSFKLSGPPRIMMDLADLSPGGFEGLERRPTGPIRYVATMTDAASPGIVRVEVGLRSDRDYMLINDGLTLHLDLAGAPAVAKGPAKKEGPPAPSPSGLPAVGGRLTAVAVTTPQDRVQVELRMDLAPARPAEEGAPSPNPDIFRLPDGRLVLDLPGFTNAVRPNVIPVRHSLLRRIRIGQHTQPRKVRVVFDLASWAQYATEDGDGILRVVLSPGAGAPPPTPPAPVALPPPTTGEPPFAAPVSIPAAPLAAPKAAPERVVKYVGKRISLDFHEAEVPNVLRLIADVSGLNLVVSEEVRGKISLKLINVPWDQALDIILKTRGLGQIRDGSVLRIDTLTNIAKQQEEEAKAKESVVKAEDLVTLLIPVNYAKADRLVDILKKSMSNRGEVTVDPATNTLILKEIPSRLKELRDLVTALDLQTPQVLIEARIVQASRSFARDLGVAWGFGTTRGNLGGDSVTVQGTNVTAPAFGLGGVTFPPGGYVVNLPQSGSAGQAGAVGITFGRLTGSPVVLDLRLSAGEAIGETNIISTPRIVTLDNKEAAIQQGESIPYQTVSQTGTQTQFIDATLNLTVTPHITPDKSIIMKIKVTKNQAGTQRVQGAPPSIDKKEASTEVLVRDGDTAVIGGILESTELTATTAVPWFAKLPFIGWLFKSDSKSDSKKELLIFITPSIIPETRQLAGPPTPVASGIVP